MTEKKLKVLHVSESSGWSGGAAQALLLATELRKLGHENILACPSGGDLSGRAAEAGFRVFDFRPRRDYDLRAALAVAALLRSERPDAMHAHHPKAHTMCVLGKFFSGLEPALVVSRRVSHPIRGGFFARLKYRARAIDAYAAVAGSVRAQLIGAGVEPGRVFTIYSGTDTALFYPRPADRGIMAELALPAGVPVVSLIGNFSRDKGQHILAASAARLAGGGREFILLFAGRGTDSPEMKALLLKEGFPMERARLLGLRRDVPELLSVTSVSVNCAVKGEALSGSIRESLAMGIPVIASDISGNSEIVSEGKTGMLFEPGDCDALARKLELALSRPDRLAALAKAGPELVRGRFSSARMAADTLALYLKFSGRAG